MTEREKLNKRHSEIISKAIDNSEEVKDLYAVDDALVHYALTYLPIKVLKKIFAKYK
jgi:hypothetical protein